ncbi:MAG: UvrB/UvrC motif-containing protein [Flavobacterium sp.]|nr:UvrB/UvrC motif-containing protein [Flavobacterium sp.]
MIEKIKIKTEELNFIEAAKFRDEIKSLQEKI